MKEHLFVCCGHVCRKHEIAKLFRSSEEPTYLSSASGYTVITAKTRTAFEVIKEIRDCERIQGREFNSVEYCCDDKPNADLRGLIQSHIR